MSLVPVTPDVARLRRTLHRIRTDPAHWVQSAWMTETNCGTAYCFAGWALVLDGIPICADDCYPFESGMVAGAAHVHHTYLPADMRTALERYAFPYGDNTGDFLCPVSVAARYLLGLKLHQADMLFCAVNSLDTITQMINCLEEQASLARQR